MTGTEALQRGTLALRAAGIAEPEIESDLLLRHALGRDRVFLYMHLPEELNLDQQGAFLEILRRRLERRPAAYLTGVREFYGIGLYVAPGVLIPRPETELLVDESLRMLRLRSDGERQPSFADIGTGCGAIAVATAKNWARARYFAVDISANALKIAALNARRPKLAGRIEFLCGDLASPLPIEVDLMAANLPYVPTSVWRTLPAEIRDHEPREALDGGEDGLAVIRRFISTAQARLRADGALLLEVGRDQAGPVLDLLREALPLSCRYALRDLAGMDRVVVADGARATPPRGAILS